MAASGGKWLKGSVMAIATMGLGVHGAVAQADNPLPWDELTEPAAYISFGVLDTEWTLYPVITADDIFIGFFGYMPDEFVVGDNVSLLWLTPDNGDGTWSMYGWSHTDLKVVSQYLDQITNTTNVLADTGLDVFAGDPQPITEPQSMPFGIAEDDPAAPIVEATQDPVIAAALIAAGAAGAPNLTEATNLQPVDGCVFLNADSALSQLDIDLATRSRVVQEMMVVWLSDSILDSLSVSGLDQDDEVLRNCWCIPGTEEVWNAWSGWSCTGGPALVGGVCNYTGCTRTRSGVRVVTYPNCTTRTTNLTETIGPMPMTGAPLPGGGGCPPNPQ
ncbi:MAG: hypothetical protein CMJ25_28555 [Phycisphaerae bacterium]|nr:hypothetical protein [Phycisphaerae bacterium]